MVVLENGTFAGTIGGGALEWQAQARAQALLRQDHPGIHRIDQALGPDLGQCCGGRVTVDIEVFTPSDLSRAQSRLLTEPDSRTPILLFGAGHVGRALVVALAPLPFAVTWNDTRPGAFPKVIPGAVVTTDASTRDVLSRAPEGAQVLVMTHSHALDLEICAQALADSRFASVGVIGSATKRARFVSRLTSMGLPRDRINALRCPIGLPGLGGKEPSVIAVSVAAESLMLRAQDLQGQSVARRRAR